MRPLDEVLDTASVLWARRDMSWFDALCLAAGSSTACIIDPDACELLEVRDLAEVADVE
jgi:hypothetical protein